MFNAGQRFLSHVTCLDESLASIKHFTNIVILDFLYEYGKIIIIRGNAHLNMMIVQRTGNKEKNGHFRKKYKCNTYQI